MGSSMGKFETLSEMPPHTALGRTAGEVGVVLGGDSGVVLLLSKIL